MERKKVKISNREEAEEFVQMVLEKANKPDADPKPYDGTVPDSDKVEEITRNLKNRFADKR